MHTLVSPIGNLISIPETEAENSKSFALSELGDATDYYHENGYVVVRGVIEHAACDALRLAWDQSVKRSAQHIYRQTTANPERNQFNEFGFVMNPVLNLQDLRTRDFAALKDLALRAFLCERMRAITRNIFLENGKLVQSMYFEGNSATWPHQDTYYLDSEKIGTMVAAWFALEDIDAGAGRFFVVPRSHRIEMAKNGGDFDIAFNHARYKQVIKKIMSEPEWEIRAPLLKKGDVLLWNAKTIHGSLRTTRPAFSRSSLTAHYIPSSHRFLQFQSRIKPLRIQEFHGMEVHCPKNMDKLRNRLILGFETTFPKTFQTAKKLAIKALVG